MVYKIALTGAHGTGKTTLSKRAESLLKAEFRVAHSPEVPRLLIEEIGELAFFQRSNNTFARQTIILARQIEEEAKLSASKIDVLICDRTVVDHWAYTEAQFSDYISSKEAQAWKRMVGRWLATYDLVCRLPIEFPMEQDGVREADEGFRSDIDNKIVSLYADFGLEIELLFGPIAQREAQFYDLVKARILP